MPRKLLFVGESPQHSAPTLTAARALKARAGYESVFAEMRDLADTRTWLKLINACDALVLVLYAAPERFLRRQIALAALLSKPVVRWWVGSDVLSVVQDPRVRRAARAFDRVVRVNVAVAPHLVEELASAGVTATFLPSLLDPGHVSPVVGAQPRRSLLVYLPSSRKDFYGFDVVRQAVEDNVDVEFVILADETHSLADHPNVLSLGWVDDLDQIWDRVGGLLRITAHDGMPRMVLDALRREKHVIYAWPLAGCRLARTVDEVQAAVREFKSLRTPNRAGLAAVHDLLTPDPAVRFAQRIEVELVAGAFLFRCRAAHIVATDTLRLKLRLGDPDVLA
jgi:hypothetical protein